METTQGMQGQLGRDQWSWRVPVMVVALVASGVLGGVVGRVTAEDVTIQPAPATTTIEIPSGAHPFGHGHVKPRALDEAETIGKAIGPGHVLPRTANEDPAAAVPRSGLRRI